jgi:hypothetical protein
VAALASESPIAATAALGLLSSPPLSPAARAGGLIPGGLQRSLLGSVSVLADLAGTPQHAHAQGQASLLGSPGSMLLQGLAAGYGSDAEGGGNGGGAAGMLFGGGLGLGDFGSTGNLTSLLGLSHAGGSGGLDLGLTLDDVLPPLNSSRGTPAAAAAGGGPTAQQQQQQEQQRSVRGGDSQQQQQQQGGGGVGEGFLDD